MSQPNYAYKFLAVNGRPCNGGTGQWHLPKNGRPGKWMPPITHLVPCQRGYHLLRPQDILSWQGPTLWLAEWRDKSIIHEDNKLVVEQARIIRRMDTWNDRNQRLLACDFAEHVAHLYTAKTDWQPAQTIAVARRFAWGVATPTELAAAGAAAGAARDAAEAARDAAWAAGEAAWAAGAAAGAARAAAGAAARDARAAAWDAERQWQTQRLMDVLEGRVVYEPPA